MNCIIDRSIYEDKLIFTKSLLKLGQISNEEYEHYCKVFDIVIKEFPIPDIIILLKTKPEILLERIKRRGREMEKSIDLEYLSNLENLYQNDLKNEMLQLSDKLKFFEFDTEKFNTPELLLSEVSAKVDF